MKLPQLTYKTDSLSVVNIFGGLNTGLNISENEFSDMQNMTNDYYPVFGNRKQRGILDSLDNPMGMCGGDDLSYVDDNKLFFHQTYVADLEETDEERQLVRMGAYLCIFPDGLIYNTKTNEITDIENVVTTTSTVKMAMCKLDGTELNSSNTYIGTSAPADTTTYQYWIDTSDSTNVVMKMWSDTYSMWTSITTTYVKISSTGIGVGFKEYDAAKFSGIKIKGYNDYDFNDTLVIYGRGDDYLIVAGIFNLSYTQSDPVTVKRELPKMDFVCEMNNRIYGCRYGYNNDEDFVNEVYACKLGDPTNWFSYAGLTGDSYTASCGSEGPFTGIVSYGGYVFFFKEEGFHKLYGTQPSNFQMIWRPCRGVQAGSSKSIAIVNEVLLFKSRDAIVAYDGTEDTISIKLGMEPMFEAVAGAYKNKYYISMRNQEMKWALYVYDMVKNTWCKEDELRAKYMAYANHCAYIVDYNNNMYAIDNEYIYLYNYPSNTLYPIDTWYYHHPEDEIYPKDELYPGPINLDSPNDLIYPGFINLSPYEDTIEWYFITGDLGLDNPYNKYLKRINLRMSLDVSAKIKIEVEYDSSGEWEYVTEQYANKKRNYDIPIAVKRADHVRLKISGWGEFRLYSITRAVEGGSGEDEG